jgi:hydroxypyruvate reductase
MYRQSIADIFDAALKAANPYNAVKKTLKIERDKLYAGKTALNLNDFNRIIVVGAGKGTALMAVAVEELLGDRLDEGIIIVKYGYTSPLLKIRQTEAAHPLPNEAGGTRRWPWPSRWR